MEGKHKMTRKRKNSIEVEEKATQMIKPIPVKEVKEPKVKVESEGIVAAVVANANLVNVREKPTKDSKVLLIVKINDPVHVLERGNIWSLIENKELEKPGYIMNEFLKVGK